MVLVVGFIAALDQCRSSRRHPSCRARHCISLTEEIAPKLDTYPDSLGEAMLQADKAFAKATKE